MESVSPFLTSRQIIELCTSLVHAHAAMTVILRTRRTALTSNLLPANGGNGIGHTQVFEQPGQSHSHLGPTDRAPTDNSCVTTGTTRYRVIMTPGNPIPTLEILDDDEIPGDGQNLPSVPEEVNDEEGSMDV